MNLNPRVQELSRSMDNFSARCQVAGENDLSVGQVNAQLSKERRQRKAAAQEFEAKKAEEIRETCANAWWQD